MRGGYEGRKAARFCRGILVYARQQHSNIGPLAKIEVVTYTCARV